MELKDYLELVPGILALGAAVVAIAKGGRKVAEYATDFLKLPTRIRTIEQELKPNGGASLKDTVNRIDNRTVLNEQLLFHVLNDFYQGTYEADENGNYTRTSIGYSHLTGKNNEENLGNNWIYNVHPDDRERVLNEWTDSFKYGRNFYSKYKLIQGNESIRVCSHAFPLYDKNKKITSWFGIVKKLSSNSVS